MKKWLCSLGLLLITVLALGAAGTPDPGSVTSVGSFDPSGKLSQFQILRGDGSGFVTTSITYAANGAPTFGVQTATGDQLGTITAERSGETTILTICTSVCTRIEFTPASNSEGFDESGNMIIHDKLHILFNEAQHDFNFITKIRPESTESSISPEKDYNALEAEWAAHGITGLNEIWQILVVAGIRDFGDAFPLPTSSSTCGSSQDCYNNYNWIQDCATCTDCCTDWAICEGAAKCGKYDACRWFPTALAAPCHAAFYICKFSIGIDKAGCKTGCANTFAPPC